MQASNENQRVGSSKLWLVSLVAASALAVLSTSANAFQLLPTTSTSSSTSFQRAAVRLSLLDQQQGSEAEKGSRVAEFMNLEPVQETEARKARLERDQVTKEQFAEYGDDLWGLRKKMTELSGKLVGALNDDDGSDSEELVRHELRECESRDPELVYEMELLEMELAIRESDTEQAKKSRQRALNARSCLPHFNLEGLWVGKYGTHGYEMINVTYVGDTMIAYKVTGDKNVPRREITFQADLSPPAVRRLRTSRGDSFSKVSKEEMQPLEPIMLTDKAATKWGTRQLPRYRGLGQVAENGFENHRWMDGQLIIIGEDYFSFAWVPLENQIFFGRPSPELALKMLREGGEEDLRTKHFEAPPSLDADVDVLKDYVTSCLAKTTETYEEEMGESEPFGCIWHGGVETEECYFE